MHYWRKRKYGDPLHVTIIRTDHLPPLERLMMFTDTSAGPKGCWEWQRGRDQCGYGTLNVRGLNSNRTHRISYQLHFGPIPPGMEVLHKCDNPPCVNPAHLELGTHAENMRQMSERKRASRGVDNPRTKLTDEQVAEARAMRAAGHTSIGIARHFGVSQPYISRLTRGLRR